MKNLFETILLIVVLMTGYCLSGCNEPLQNSISYRCDLSGSGVDVNRSFGTQFASQVSAAANLRFSSETPITGVPSADTAYIVELVSNAIKDLSVSIVCDRNSKTVAVMIRGNIHTAEAEMIGQKASAVFSAMLPGQKLTLFVARQGFLGP